jgi:hypothetical protein
VKAPSIEVFNVSVESESNYFAGGVLVHNKEPTVIYCEGSDIGVGQTSKVGDEPDGAARHRLDVTTPRPASLSVGGYGLKKGAAKADVPLSSVTANSSEGGRRWSVDVVVPAGLGAILSLSGTSTSADGAECSIAKTVDAVEPP